MNLDKIFDESKFRFREVRDELYNLAKPGVIAIPEFLTKYFCDYAIEEFRKGADLFREAPKVEGETRQELKIHYFGNQDHAFENTGQFPSVSRLREEFSFYYRLLGNIASFSQGSVINSVGVHHYQEGSCGMGIHRDYSNDINLLSLLVLSGNADFSVFDDKKGTNRIFSVETTPGMLVLMRGPRGKDENDFRPYHQVGEIKKERYSVILRQKKLDNFSS